MMSRFRSPALGALAVAWVALTLGGTVGCGGSSGGGGSGNLSLVSFNLQNINGVKLNERLIFTFSTNVDPASVNVDTIQIRFDGSMVDRDGDGNPDEPGNTNATPPGDFVVDGNKVFFNPKLPVRPSNTDTGFIPDIAYTVTIPPFPELTVRSANGRSLTQRFATTFRTVGDPAFPPGISLDSFDDFFQGNPTVSAIVTPDPVPGNPLLATNAPKSTAIEIRFSEPVLPSSVQDGLFLEAIGPNTGRTSVVSAITSVIQDPESTRVRFEPTVDLPGNVELQVIAATSIRDFGGNRLEPSATPIVVQIAPGMVTESDQFFSQGALVAPEDFAFQTNFIEDPNETGASWNGLGTEGTVVASGGGSGADGALVLQGDFILDTDSMGPDGNPRNGVFQYTRLTVPDGVTLTGVGSFPLLLFVSGRADIRGTLTVSGTNGENASVGGLGGDGGPGGGRGGDGGIDGFGSNGQNGGGPGGGQGSIGAASAAQSAGGAGGAGHAEVGRDGRSPDLPPGLGGPAYGDQNACTAGSGGGGSGFENLNPGSGGGGGGGLIKIQCGRELVVAGGTIDASGGNGGRANTPQGTSGGGGSGGGIVLQSARNVLAISGNTPPVPASILAIRGDSGVLGEGQNTRRGGNGSEGRIHIETGPDAAFIVDTEATIDPPEMPSATPPNMVPFILNGRSSVAVSRFLDSRQLFPDYVFNPAVDADPAPTASVTYLFQGAPEDPTDPGRPDLGNTVPASGFTANIDDVDDLRFIRFAIQFTTPAGGAPILSFDDPALPRANSIRFRYFFQ